MPALCRFGDVTAIPALRDLLEQIRVINPGVKEGGYDVHVVNFQSESSGQACKVWLGALKAGGQKPATSTPAHTYSSEAMLLVTLSAERASCRHVAFVAVY